VEFLDETKPVLGLERCRVGMVERRNGSLSGDSMSILWVWYFYKSKAEYFTKWFNGN